MSSIKVEIVTPMRRAFEGTVREVQIPGWLGELGVLPGHAALLALSKAGVVSMVGAEGSLTVDKETVPVTGDRRLIIGAGIAEVGPESVTLIVDLCEDSANVNRPAAEAALAAAETVLSSADPGSAEWTLNTKAAELARARLSV